jgi:hypothetical protein
MVPASFVREMLDIGLNLDILKLATNETFCIENAREHALLNIKIN